MTSQAVTNEDLAKAIAELSAILSDHIVASEARFDKLEGRFDNLEARFDNLEARFDKLEGRFDNLEARFDNLEESVDELTVDFAGAIQDLADHMDARFDEQDGRWNVEFMKLRTEIRSEMHDLALAQRQTSEHLQNVDGRLLAVENDIKEIYTLLPARGSA